MANDRLPLPNLATGESAQGRERQVASKESRRSSDLSELAHHQCQQYPREPSYDGSE